MSAETSADEGVCLDYEQALSFLAALYQAGDIFHLLAVTEKGAEALYSPGILEKVQSSPSGRYGFLARPGGREEPAGCFYGAEHLWWVKKFLQDQNRDRKFQVAATVGVFEPMQPKQERYCMGLSAFALDIDPDDFPNLVPGAIAPEQIIPEVLARLQGVGLRPQALVHSGRGLHVYILIERIAFSTDQERNRAKDIWWRLGKLVAAPDRHDLSSMMRVPGTINWKGGIAKPVRFIAEHTDLSRPRYRLEDVAKAVAHLEPMPPEKGLGSRRVARARRVDAGDPGHDIVLGDADDYDRFLLDVALRLDKTLQKARAKANDPKTKDHSNADWAYTCRMLELGLPQSIVLEELQQGYKGSADADPDHYADATFRRASGQVWPTTSTETSSPWQVVGYSPEALYTARSRTSPSLSSSRGSSTAPKVRVVIARAGQGKTRGLVDALARARYFEGERLGLVGLFVRELLRHERAINTYFPHGLEAEGQDGESVAVDDDHPLDHEALWHRLPAEIQKLWSVEELKARVRDPAAFFLNALHPYYADERLQGDDIPGSETPENPGGEKMPPVSPFKAPTAVVKFRGTEDLCLHHYDARELRRTPPPCARCPLVACRANTSNNEEQRGAKTYWEDSPVALLSHRAFVTQTLFKPELNRFTKLVVDELPDFVYRCPKLTISPKRDRHGRQQWSVEPLDTVQKFLNLFASEAARGRRKVGMETRERIAAVSNRFDTFRKQLTDRARGRLKRVEKGEAIPFERKADEQAPLLSSGDFGLVLDLSRERVPSEMDFDPEDLDSGSRQLGEAMETLRDFCGDEPHLDVYLEHGFRDGQSKAQMWMYRPRDGWDDVLRDHHGHERDVILLDATAGLDPRYQLRGQFGLEQVPPGNFENTTIVLTGSGTTSKRRLDEKRVAEVADEVVTAIRPYREQLRGGLLVLTNRDRAKKLDEALQARVAEGALPGRVTVAHFGALRGRNDFRDYDGVYFTHPHRHPEASYIGLGLLIHGFRSEKIPRQWESKNAWEDFEAIRARAVVAETYQDAMRIGLRSDPGKEAVIFFPSDDAAYVVRLMRLFKGGTLIAQNGDRLAPSRSPAPDATRTESDLNDG